MMSEIVPETKTGEDANPQAPSQERTEKDKVIFNLKKKADEAKALGIDISEVIGFTPKMPLDTDIPDDKNLTYGDLRNIQKQDAKKTALQMAEDITDETERIRVKEILNRLSPSGDAHADLALARGSVNSEKNARIAEEAARKGQPARHASNPGTGGKPPEEQFEPSPEEATMMRPPFNLSKEEILAARPK